MTNYTGKSRDVEEAVLGSLLKDNGVWDEIGDYLVVDDFLNPFHRDVYRVIRDLILAGKAADVICVSQIIKNERGEKNDQTFINLCEIFISGYAPSNIKYYAEIVKKNSIDRKLIQSAQDIIVYVNEKNDNGLDYAQARISEIVDQIPSEIISASDVLKSVMASIDERQKSKDGMTGIPTGFYDLDKITHGLHPGDLIILAGRPSMGKTVLAMNIAEQVALVEKLPVAMFSLEMSKEQLMERSLVSVAHIDAEHAQTGRLNDDDLQKISSAIPKFYNAKLFIDDRSSSSVSDIRSKCRRIKREYGLSLVIVDYLSLMGGEGENETIRMGNISRGLKLLARDLKVPVIAISQLNRGVEQRNDKRPTMSDLRQSGAIEQDADLIFFIYRDEIYNKNSPNKGAAEVIIAKHRNGALGTINLSFSGKHCRFDNYSGALISNYEASSHGRSFIY